MASPKTTREAPSGALPFRTRVRMVDVRSSRYAIARRYMIRLRRDDFENPAELAKCAATAHCSVERFREEFEPLIADEPPPHVLATGAV